MGSSAGKLKKHTGHSAVVSIHIKQDDRQTDSHYSSTSSKSKTVGNRKGQEEENMMSGSCSQVYSESNKKATEIEKQMAELECECLNLHDQLQNMEQEIEFLRAMKTEDDIAGLTETIKAKDVYIEQLQQETTTAKEECNKMRVKYKKKLKAISSKLVQEKQDGSLKVFELHGEMNRLIEENSKLRGILAKRSIESKGEEGSELELEEDSRTKIILELSSRVSDQDAKITELLSQVSDQDAKITELLSQVATKDRIIVKMTKDQEGRNTSINDPEQQVAVKTRTDHSDMAELKLIAQEMRSLQQKNRRKPPSGADQDTRQSSGISRDSGIDYCAVSDASKSAWGKLTSQNRANSATSYTSSVLSDMESDGDEFCVNPENDFRTKTGKPRVGDLDCDQDIGSGSTSYGVLPEVAHRKNDRIAARLDPASVRKISASGQRRKSKSKGGLSKIRTISSHNNSSEIAKPLPHKPRDRDVEDADILLKNIDKTLYNNPHIPNITTASVA